jgi:hypothetical protein
MGDDTFVGQGGIIKNGLDTLYSINYLDRTTFNLGDSLYFQLFKDGANVSDFDVSPNQNNFRKNKVPVPTTPGTDERIDLYVREGNATGIDDTRHLDRLKVYPNPTKGMLNVDLGEGESVKSVRIFDSSGRLLEYEMNGARSGVYQLNLEGMSSGLYFINIENSNGSRSTTKFIKY